MTNENSPKISNKFYCEKCDYKCFKKSEWLKHTYTRKHKIRTNDEQITPKNPNMYVCDCGKSYKHVSSLWNHKQKCKIIKPEDKQSEPMLEYLLKENIEMKKMLFLYKILDKKIKNEK
jgi:hypothetical protein